ncbi:alpha/beta hydrolase [Marinobacter sp. CHS3-4]|uniref:alpha/beta hydrolase n=1 Tax=Marinobacter sp. CHS3-4 TaxID=3045174 RepID=UPI0024B5F13C|nr:alpha/beta hydrolase [Marinobacter sp. CHS3-4]MDI9245365.1 alpha/beta fold hydrolase [Marinobacter sp. CHS3-4]
MQKKSNATYTMSIPVIQLLGSPEIGFGQNDALHLRKKSIELLAFLVTNPRSHPRDRLAMLLWPDAVDSRKLLRNAIYELRQRLGRNALVAHADVIKIDDSIASACDIGHLKSLSASSAKHAPILSFEEIERLCSGDFLEGFQFADCDGMADWCYAMRESVMRWRCKLLEQQTDIHRSLGKIDVTLQLLRLWYSLDEYNECVVRQIIEALIEKNQLYEAERLYEAFKRRLHEQLGIAPSNDLARLILKLGQAPRASNKDNFAAAVPETHYLQSNGVFLAYQTLGTESRTLIVINGFMSHLEQIWENPELARFYRQLANQFRLVLFDKRGCGMSDRVASAPSPDDIALDVHAIMSKLHLKQAVILGFSEGGAAAITFAARFPKLVERLILYGSSAKWMRTPDYKPALTPQQFDVWQEQLVSQWGSGKSIEEFAPSQRSSIQSINWWAKTMRLSSSPGEISKIMLSIREIDVRAQLEKVKHPTLILHKIDDRIVRFDAAKDLAKRLPNAVLKPLDGIDHWFWTECADEILDLINDQCRGAGPANCASHLTRI